MGTGPNWAGLDKGMATADSVAYNFGEAVGIAAPSQSVKHLNAAATAADVVGVVQETVDLAKVQTNKAKVNVRFSGITKGIAGAAIAKGARLNINAANQFVTQGTANGVVVGIAMEACSGAGLLFDILLTPGATL